MYYTNERKQMFSDLTIFIYKTLSVFTMYVQVLSYRVLENSVKLNVHKNEATSTNTIMWKHVTFMLLTYCYEIFHSALSFYKIENFGLLFKLVYNSRQNVWKKVKKSNKIEQNQKTSIIPSALFFDLYYKSFISGRKTR